MRTRLDLQKLLEKTLGSRNVYFQPPPNVQMEYPAIVYKRQKIDNDFGDDLVYIIAFLFCNRDRFESRQPYCYGRFSNSWDSI